jgi:deoxyribonuclease IV
MLRRGAAPRPGRPPTTIGRVYHGAHLATAGGAHKALERARAIRATSLQIFTQSPRMWRHPALDLDAAARFRAARKPSRVAVVVCHATYLINLGASDREVYEKSARALADTLRAAEAIEADGVVFHLGSHLGRGLEAVMPQVTEALAGVLSAADPDSPTRLVIENSAGAGGTMGVGLDEIERIVAALGRPERVGVCLDTCHLWASGVDVTDPGRVDDLMAEVDERFGLGRLACLHVNDAAVPLGSQRDRHAEVGRGVMGKELAVILGHPAVQDVAAIMETPGDGEQQPYARSMRALRRIHRDGVRRWTTERAGA